MKLSFCQRSMFAILILLLAPQAGHGQAMRFSASALPIASGGYGHGASFGSFTRNGRPSLFVIAYGVPNNLFENLGTSFRDIAEQAGVLLGTDHDRGMASADFDNDGDLDIYISAGYTGNVFWRNNGDDTFSDYTADSGTYLNGQGQGVAWGDFNNDGWLDLFVAQTDGGNRLYLNNGGSNFYENSGPFESESGSLQPVTFDVNGDGNLDLLVTRRAKLNNLLYINRGGGNFDEQGNQWGIAEAGAECHGAGVGDYDCDGDLDVFICTFTNSNLLFRNMGGRFEEVGSAAGIRSSGTRNRGALFGDFNDDGWPDIYVTRTGANQLFQNNGNGTFTEVGAVAGANDGRDGYTPSMADYDNDGDLDIFFTNTGQQSILLQNLGSSNNRLELRLRGTKSNANGVGAILTAWLNGRPQAQAIISGQGYVGTGSDLTAHFGLGSSSFLDTLLVKWPSGMQEKYYHLAANQKLVLVEGKAPVDRTAPRISEIVVDKVTMTGVTINWKTNEETDSQIEYGLTASYGSFSSRDGNLVMTHATTLSGLTMNTMYHYRVRSRDAAGNLAISSDFTFTTARDTLAPEISNLTTTAITANSAQIKWSTDEPGDARVEYGSDSTAFANSVLDTSFATTHTVNLVNLSTYTTYYFHIITRDRAGNSRMGTKQSFKTLPTIAGLSRVSGNAQSGRAGEVLALPLVVHVANSAGDNVGNVKVEFRVISGGGRVMGESNCDSAVCVAATNPLGQAGIKWRLGKTDSQKVKVTILDKNDLVTFFTATLTPTTAVEAKAGGLPAALALRQYPNPFHDFARFEIDLPAAGLISLKIYDLQGREVITLAEGWRNAGQYPFPWQVQSGASRLPASGVYFAVLRYQSELKFSPGATAPMSEIKQRVFYVK